MGGLRTIGLLAGVAFGFLLVASRLTDYDVIHAGLLLHSPYIYLLMASSVGTATVALLLLERARWRTPLGGPLAVRRVPIQRRHVLGGIVFGLGWATVGTCPLVSAAQLASGTLLGGVVMVGLLVGILLRDATAGSSTGAGPAPAVTIFPGLGN